MDFVPHFVVLKNACTQVDTYFFSMLRVEPALLEILDRQNLRFMRETR